MVYREGLFALGAFLLFVCPSVRAESVIFGGVEDTPGSTGLERNGDYNDLVFKMSGTINIKAAGTVLTDLLAGSANESHAHYWENPSLDGPNFNVGFCLLGGGSCTVTNPPLAGVRDVTSPGGEAPLDIAFSAQGPVTVEFLLGQAGLARFNTLGWYQQDDPNSLHFLFAGLTQPGTSVTFTPTGLFRLFFTSGFGTSYSTAAALNWGESPTQQHFAFFVDGTAPEPATIGLIGIALLGFGARYYMKLKAR